MLALEDLYEYLTALTQAQLVLQQHRCTDCDRQELIRQLYKI